MKIERRTFLGYSAVGAASLLGRVSLASEGPVQHFVRYRYRNRIAYGLLKGQGIHELEGGLFDTPKPTGTIVALKEAELLVPCEPSKVLGAVFNYAGPNGEKPDFKTPEFFFKAPSSLLADGGIIELPEDAGKVVYEGELAIVIGKKTKKVTVADAKQAVFGVSCGNDVSGADWSGSDVQWWRAKASDTFAGLGPAIVTGLNYEDIRLRTRVNGTLKQDSRTSQPLFDIPTMISHLSQYLTLEPGDVIYTGTPPGAEALNSGDQIEIEIEGIGVLNSRVA